MHGLISWGMFLSDSAARWQHVTYLVDVLPRLPYCEELRPAYEAVANYYRLHVKDREAGERWGSLYSEQAQRHHDLRAQVMSLNGRGKIWTADGNLRAAEVPLQQAAVLAAQIGDVPAMITVADAVRQHILVAGEIELADQRAVAGLFGELGAPARWVQGLLAAWQATCQLCLGERGSLQDARREIAGYLPLLPIIAAAMWRNGWGGRPGPSASRGGDAMVPGSAADRSSGCSERDGLDLVAD